MHLPEKILLLFLLLLSPAISAQKPFVLGTVETFQSATLGEQRTVNIYLPENYSADDTASYPVIYLLDGSADEDFIHVAGLLQFYTFPWIGMLRPSILVGIANTDRKRDFTFPTTIAGEKEKFPTTGGSSAFIRFIQSELQPFIDKKYRTTKSRTIIGQSLGGLLAAEILLTKPQLFTNYVIVSPSLWWDDGSLLRRPPGTENFTQPASVYIAVGKEGPAPSANPHIMETDAGLLSEKINSLKRPQVTVFFDYLPDENHATILHQAVMNSIKFMSGNNR